MYLHYRCPQWGTERKLYNVSNKNFRQKFFTYMSSFQTFLLIAGGEISNSSPTVINESLSGCVVHELNSFVLCHNISPKL